jgi:hypothetical protein
MESLGVSNSATSGARMGRSRPQGGRELLEHDGSQVSHTMELRYQFAMSIVLLGAVVATAAEGPLPEGPLPEGAVARLDLPAKDGEWSGAYVVAISPDGSLAAVRDNQQDIHLVSIPDGTTKHTLVGHEATINSMEFSPDGSVLLSAADELGETVRAWDVATGSERRRWSHAAQLVRFVGPKEFVSIGAVDVRHCVLGQDNDGYVRGQLPNRTSPLAVASTGNRIFMYHPNPVASETYSIFLYSVEDQHSYVLDDLPFRPQRALFSPDDHLLAVCGSRSSDVAIFDLLRGTNYLLLQGHQQTVYSLAFTSDGRHFISGAFDGSVHIWETLTWRPIARIQTQTAHVNALATSRDGRWLVTGAAGTENVVSYIWSLSDLLNKHIAAPILESKPSIERLWGMLGADDPARAYWAMHQLQQDVDGTAFIAKQVQSFAATVSAEQVAQWIDWLDDDRYTVREDAFRQLMRHRAGFDDQLRQAVRSARTLETRLRLRQLLAQESADTMVDGDEWRRMNRLVYLLERDGAVTAKKQLEALADGHPDRRVAALARSAHGRLER